VIIKSTAAGLSVGAMVDEAQVIDVQAGAAVTLVTPAGATLTRAGPFNGPAVGPKSSGDNAVVKLISHFLEQKKSDTSIGAIRGHSIRTYRNPEVIPVSLSGRYCIAAADIRLWRGDTDVEETFNLRTINGSSRAAITFRRTESTAPWPIDVPIKNGGIYLTRVKGSTRSSYRLDITVASAPIEDPIVRIGWMIEQDCTRQADLLIDGLEDS
jgi:hypothetical protein